MVFCKRDGESVGTRLSVWPMPTASRFSANPANYAHKIRGNHALDEKLLELLRQSVLLLRLSDELQETMCHSQSCADTLARDLDGMRQKPESAFTDSPTTQPEEQEVALIRGLIKMRDNLLIRKEWLHEHEITADDAEKLLNSLLQETAILLESVGVEILNKSGTFDNQIQTVVRTEAATSLEQANQIVETFRPGYALRGQILRPQEVILFVKE